MGLKFGLKMVRKDPNLIQMDWKLLWDGPGGSLPVIQAQKVGKITFWVLLKPKFDMKIWPRNLPQKVKTSPFFGLWGTQMDHFECLEGQSTLLWGSDPCLGPLRSKNGSKRLGNWNMKFELNLTGNLTRKVKTSPFFGLSEAKSWTKLLANDSKQPLGGTWRVPTLFGGLLGPKNLKIMVLEAT